jgi:tRNA pseudouridine38-40 synthase
MSNFRYFVRLMYDGTNYHGWQNQKNAFSVQELIEKGFSLIFKEKVKVTGCGRTDTGVHAKDFYLHFDLSRQLGLTERKKLVFNLNGYLPMDIAIRDILPVMPNANSRFSAISRTYQYVITTFKDPFADGYAWYLYSDLDTGLMNRGARLLLKTHDFTSFSKVNTQSATNLCKVSEAHCERVGENLIFTIRADRFLRNMVRAIVGTLIALGRKKISLKDLQRIIDGKDRSLAWDSVPACGLYLVKVEYPEEIFLIEN